MIKFMDLYSQYGSIKQEIDSAISKVIETSGYINSEFNLEFENSFAKYIGVEHCVGVANGTDALEIAIESLGLPPNSEIIVPANTFIASAEAVCRNGHRVIFADIDEHTYNISGKSIRNVITDNTKAVIAVHLYGYPCDIGSIKEVCEENSLYLIEDCAQAHGAKYRGLSIGQFGIISAFSFYPGKNLGGYGDAGAIVTNCAKLAEKCRKISNHGRKAKYDHEFIGRNSRLDGLQAAILSVKLRYLDEWLAKRNGIAKFYLENLRNVGDIILPAFDSAMYHAYHLFVIRTSNRNDLKEFLLKNGVETGIHYPIALPKIQAFASNVNLKKTSKFFACQIDSNLLSLPVGEHLNFADAKNVVGLIQSFFKEKSSLENFY
jgi:dTDP-4-amino-4,6-dideoxygalactose transaminase